MTLGALIDAGVPFDELQRALGGLALGDAHVHAKKVLRAGVSATKFSVHEHAHGSVHHHHDDAPHVHGSDQHVRETDQHVRGSDQHIRETDQHVRETDQHPDHSHRSLPEIFALIDRSSVAASARERAKAMFQRLAEVEASIHGMPVERVHLHEVGAVDSIIDIVGTAFAMDWIGADRVACSPLNVGSGMVQSAHGRFPVPAPATLKLLGDAPVYGGSVAQEMVTPTGALIATTYASSFGPMPSMTVERVGYGAGDRDHPSTPNVLRVVIGRDAAAQTEERVTVIECEIDDMNPQIFGVAMDRLYAAGALEVFYVPVQMKKNRPGTLLTVVAAPAKRPALADVIFRETTTIGLRYHEVARECLQREIVTVETSLGAVRFKIAYRDGRVINAVPEFEDCARLAAANNLSVKDVQTLAIKAYEP